MFHFQVVALWKKKCQASVGAIPAMQVSPLSVCRIMWQCMYPVVQYAILSANTHSWIQLIHVTFGHAYNHWIITCNIDQDPFPVARFQIDKPLWALVTATGNEGHMGLWQQNEQGDVQSRHKKWKTEIMLQNVLELPCSGLLLQNLWNQETDFSQYIDGYRKYTAEGWKTF